MLFFVLSALAGEPAFWNSEGVASQSALFGRAQSRDARGFEGAQAQLEAKKRAVAALDLGVALVGSPPALRDAATDARRKLAGQFLRLQRHADLLATDYEQTFGAAVQRALPTVGKGLSVVECTPPSGIQALMRRSSASCAGTDLNAALARAIDADPVLQAAVEELLEVEWPSIELPAIRGTVVALSGSARSVDAASLARKLRPEEVQAAQDAYEAAIEQLDGLDSEDEAVKKAAIAKAEAARAAWSHQVAAVGTGLWPEAKKKLSAAKYGDVGVCPVPAALGGCGVEDVSEAALAAMK